MTDISASNVVKAFPELFSESVEAKIYAVAKRPYDGSLPQYTEQRGTSLQPYTYQYTQPRFWTSGFFPGSLWLLYERSKTLGVVGKVSAETWKELAIKWTEPLREQRTRSDTHDLGFLFMPTFHKWAKLCPEESSQANEVVSQVADGLASRFNDYVGCTRSWDQSGHLVNGEKKEDMDKHFLVIIDNMMNLDLLYYAESISGRTSSRLSDVATMHAMTTIANHFHRSNGTYHVLNYNQKPGVEPRIIKRWAAQGYGDESVWSRGQAWAIYGFASCAEWTDVLAGGEATGFKGQIEFVDQARKAADYFIENLGKNELGVPPWDFDAPANADVTPTFRDVSAGMIAACGMVKLHSILRRSSPAQPTGYLCAALQILRATIKYCATPAARFVGEQVDLGDCGWDTILNQSTINYNENAARRWADCGLVYADYYFLELGNALLVLEQEGLLDSRDLSA